MDRAQREHHDHIYCNCIQAKGGVMCGRINVIEDPLARVVSEILGIHFAVKTNTDLRPTQAVEVVAESGDRHLQQMSTTWGIQPQWAKRLLTNAQAETVHQKPTFKKAFAERRCLVPCSGWYEWRDEGGARKQKYLFEHADGAPLFMGAIWYPAEQPQIVTLTTAPNTKCAEYHSRMPVLIEPEQIDFWFGSTSDEVQPLLQAINGDKVRVVAA